jgi:hypothetical protein
MFVVEVHEQRAEALTGTPPLAYTSPPQTEQDARALAALLADGQVDGPGPWRHPIAGGPRTIELHPVRA